RGSVAVFELFSLANNDSNDTSSSLVYPNADDLMIRFYFRNGTSNVNTSGGGSGSGSYAEDYQSYPLFRRGPSQTDVSWTEFYKEMSGLGLSSVSEWCKRCGAYTIFCAGYESSASNGNGPGPWRGRRGGGSGGMSPAAGGAIGAVVALGVAGLVFAMVMLLGGVRFRRIRQEKKSEMGGFKGSAKLASDADLTLPKGGAGASVVSSREEDRGHERVGSWELRQKEGENAGRKASFEEDDDIGWDLGAKPVKPDERV
ncbi:hypothetical protein LTS18_000257, partial [Coniosporium uncinatum]